MRGLSHAAALVALSSRAAALDWDSTAHEILIPTTFPELEEPDPWFCAASNLTHFWDVPRPPDDIYEAFQARGAAYFNECKSAFTNMREARAVCNPDKDHWCQITTTAPPSALADYLSYGSSASSWWKAHSSDALELAPECPDNWYNAMFEFPAAESWLNRTIIYGACYEEAMAAAAAVTTTTGTIDIDTSTVTTLVGATAVPGDSGTDQGVTATPSPESESGGVVWRDKSIWTVMIMVATTFVNGRS